MSQMPAIDERYELYRVITDFDALHEAFRERVEDLEITRLALDEAGGFTPGYAAKLLCVPPMKRIGQDSLPKMLKATGMALVLVVDDERFAPVKAKMAKRKKAPDSMRTVVRIKRVKGYFTKENAGILRKLAWEKIPEAKRKLMARKAARARWRKRRRELRAARLQSATASQELHPDLPERVCP